MSWLTKWPIYVTILKLSHSFNIDADFPIFLTSPTARQSYFGYSSQIQADMNLEKRVYVGAPMHTTGGNQLGAVFSCSLDLQDSTAQCIKLSVPNLSAGPDEEAAGQMFGAALSADQERLYTCAPRRQHKYFQQQQNTTFMAMQGSCWSMDLEEETFNQPVNYLSGVRELYGNPERGQYLSLYGGTGFSIHAGGQVEQVVYGTPGSFDWSGSFLKVREGTVDVANPKVWEHSHFTANDYSGYSVTTGDFNGEKVVLGAPRGGLYRAGQVLLMTLGEDIRVGKAAITHQKLSGTQTGEYFGASLVTGDFNGDGQTDLVVGSPLHTASKHRMKRAFFSYTQRYEEGRVSVYTSLGGTLILGQTISPGSTSLGGNGARFGSALGNPGDLTGDDRDELVVGAPGADEGRGMIYIYRGSEQSGVSEKPMQVIKARDIRDNLRSFGLFISRGKDVDDNDFKDIVVGAPDADTAILLRSYPAVEYTASLRFEPTSLTVETMEEFSLVVCHSIKPRKRMSRYVSGILTNITITTDRNIQFRSTGNNQMIYDWRLSKENLCETHIMQPSRGFSVNRPSRVTMQLTQVFETSSRFCKECGRIDPIPRSEWTESIEFRKGCRKDTCESDISVTAKVEESGEEGYVIGKERKLTLIAEVMNLGGDPSYRPRLLITFPKSLKLLKETSNCNQKDQFDSKLLICSLRSPLMPQAAERINITLDGSLLFAGIPKLEFNLDAGSDNEDTDLRNNKFDLIQPLVSLVDLEMIGHGQDERQEFRINDDIIFTSFKQIYQVRNHGLSPVHGVYVKTSVPIGLVQNERSVNLLGRVTGSILVAEESKACEVTLPAVSQPEGAMSLDLNCSVPGTPCLDVLCGPVNLQTPNTVAEIIMSGTLETDSLKRMDIKIFSITTEAEVTVPSLDPNILSINDVWVNMDTYTTVFFTTDTSSAGVPLWQIIVSGIGGLILLLIIIIILVKCGFFRRKTKEMEEQDKVVQEFQMHNQTSENPPTSQSEISNQSPENQPMINQTPEN